MQFTDEFQAGVIWLLTFLDDSWSSAVLIHFNSCLLKWFMVATKIPENKFHFILYFFLIYLLKVVKDYRVQGHYDDGAKTYILDRSWYSYSTWTQMPGHRTVLSYIPLLSGSMLPFPPVRPNTSKQFYLQLWSSWPWESRWSWPSSPVLKSWGAGQRNTGIFSSSRKSPLCICVAPQSWAWCSCGGNTVPEASERKQVQRTTHIKRGKKEGRKKQGGSTDEEQWLAAGCPSPPSDDSTSASSGRNLLSWVLTSVPLFDATLFLDEHKDTHAHLWRKACPGSHFLKESLDSHLCFEGDIHRAPKS